MPESSLYAMAPTWLALHFPPPKIPHNNYFSATVFPRLRFSLSLQPAKYVLALSDWHPTDVCISLQVLYVVRPGDSLRQLSKNKRDVWPTDVIIPHCNVCLWGDSVSHILRIAILFVKPFPMRSWRKWTRTIWWSCITVNLSVLVFHLRHCKMDFN